MGSILKLFRLNRVNTGAFVKLNKAITNMLRIIGPYVVYGYPNIDTIFNLVYLRGFCMFNGVLVALTNNTPITHALGEFGIYFIDDIVKEIASIGTHFKEVNQFLSPFRLA